jgi:hypothetical protein
MSPMRAIYRPTPRLYASFRYKYLNDKGEMSVVSIIVGAQKYSNIEKRKY